MTVTPLRQMAIETRHLSKRFGEVTALDDINLCIARGEFVAIMGASGSGKTTLMNILTCLDTASEGQVILDGTDAAALDEEGRRRVRAQGSPYPQLPALRALCLLPAARLPRSAASERPPFSRWTSPVCGSLDHQPGAHRPSHVECLREQGLPALARDRSTPGR